MFDKKKESLNQSQHGTANEIAGRDITHITNQYITNNYQATEAQIIEIYNNVMRDMIEQTKLDLEEHAKFLADEIIKEILSVNESKLENLIKPKNQFLISAAIKTSITSEQEYDEIIIKIITDSMVNSNEENLEYYNSQIIISLLEKMPNSYLKAFIKISGILFFFNANNKSKCYRFEHIKKFINDKIQSEDELIIGQHLKNTLSFFDYLKVINQKIDFADASIYLFGKLYLIDSSAIFELCQVVKTLKEGHHFCEDTINFCIYIFIKLILPYYHMDVILFKYNLLLSGHKQLKKILEIFLSFPPDLAYDELVATIVMCKKRDLLNNEIVDKTFDYMFYFVFYELNFKETDKSDLNYLLQLQFFVVNFKKYDFAYKGSLLSDFLYQNNFMNDWFK